MKDSEECSVQITYNIPDHPKDDSNIGKLTPAPMVHVKRFSASQLPPAGMGLPKYEKPRKVRGERVIDSPKCSVMHNSNVFMFLCSISL
jgi:hypothetical protein